MQRMAAGDGMLSRALAETLHKEEAHSPKLT